MACNTLLLPLLGLTDGRIGPIRSISWSRRALAPVCLFCLECTIQSAFVEQFLTLLLEGRGWGSIVLRVEFWPLLNFTALKPEIGRGSEFRSWHEYTGNASRLSQGEWVPPGFFPKQVGLCGGPMKNIHQSWLLLSKIQKIFTWPRLRKRK